MNLYINNKLVERNVPDTVKPSNVGEVIGYEQYNCVVTNITGDNVFVEIKSEIK